MTFSTTNLNLSVVLAAYGITSGKMSDLRGRQAWNPDGSFVTAPVTGNFPLLATFGGRANGFTGTLPNNTFTVFSSANSAVGLGRTFILRLSLLNFSYNYRNGNLYTITFTINIDIEHDTPFFSASTSDTSGFIINNGVVTPISIPTGIPQNVVSTIVLNASPSSTFSIGVIATGIGTYQGNRQVNTGSMRGTWNFIVGSTAPAIQ